MILLVTPSAPAAVQGNSVTARRWATVLGELGYQVEVAEDYAGGDYTALVALHARKSADSVRAFRTANPAAPVLLALTGTDLYPGLADNGVDPAVLETADRIIVLQSHAPRQLDAHLRRRTSVIVQSMPAIEARTPRDDVFEVAFLAHLRSVKEPLHPAEATRLLPRTSRVLVTHVGAALEEDLGARARALAAENPRYVWLGEQPRAETLAVLARSRLLVVSSRNEGGANVVSEALAAGVPVLSTAIPGSIGLLGEDYPGYFPVGDVAALADLLRAAECDRDSFYGELIRRCEQLRGLVAPERERDAWASLLADLAVTR